MDRRDFFIASGAVAVGLAFPSTPTAHAEDVLATIPLKESAMPFTLPPLPYDVAALEPFLTKENLELHHGKHHNAYVVNLNKFAEDGKVDGTKSLEEIILSSDGPVFNNAAQIWNHTFYWNSMKPKGGGEPTGKLAEAIVRDFGSFAKFKEEFAAACVGQFGSGWGWLVVQADRAHHVRRLGTRLLPDVQEPPAQVRRGVSRQPGELGLCHGEFRTRVTRTDP
jgi:Fe-Mn family superoxide dismutase